MIDVLVDDKFSSLDEIDFVPIRTAVPGLVGLEVQSTEVTQQVWFKVMGYNRSRFRQQKFCQKNHKIIHGIRLCPLNPVESISYEEIQVFISKLNSKNYIYNLPSIVEWESAIAVFVDDFKQNLEHAHDYVWYSHNSDQQTHGVGQKKSLAGLYDMFGNVWEVMKDRSPNGDLILKGGYWHAPPDFLTKEFTAVVDPGRADDTGFRLVRRGH